MFNNFIKICTGRTNVKILATLLIITLTFANFALLCTFMFESIAINISNQTNVDNVKFDVYLDANDTSVKEINKDINSEDLILYVAVNIQNSGTLQKAHIDFSNANFKLKEEKTVFEKDLGTISTGENKIIEIPISARKDLNYNLSLLNMDSQIKLTGEFVKEDGTIENVESVKTVKVNWTTDEITEEQIELNQEIVTNKIFEIEGENKRVIQLLVKSKITDNKAPVKATKLEIENPKLYRLYKNFSLII